MANDLGKTLGKLASAHPGVSFALHARHGPSEPMPGGEPQAGGFDLRPPRLPGLTVLRIGMPSEGFTEKPPAEPGPGKAPKGPEGVSRPPSATEGDKPPRSRNPAQRQRPFRGEQLE